MAAGTGIRPAEGRDREAFLEMWKDFLDAKPSEPGNHDMAAVNFDRAVDPAHPLRMIVAVDDADVPVGFTLFLSFPFSFSLGDVCYLLDIYVRSGERGRGYAGAMIEHLVELGRQNGWYKIFWMTEADNHRAQRLYDRVAKKMSYIRYDLEISKP